MSLADQFSANVRQVIQQKGSKLWKIVTREGIKGKYGYIDQIGRVDAVKKTVRHDNTPQMDTPHRRRRIGLETYHWADLVDNEDKLKSVYLPESEYVKAGGYAMGRAIDKVIIEAAFGNAYTGVSGETVVGLPTSQIIDPNCSSRFTFEKLREIKALFDEDDAPSEGRYIVLTSSQLDDLLGETKVTSSDFASAKALAEGELREFMGFKFIQLNAKDADGELFLPKVMSGENKIGRSCLAFQTDGLCLGEGQVPTMKMTERDDKCYATQVYYEMTIGATRMQEELVIKVNCKE